MIMLTLTAHAIGLQHVHSWPLGCNMYIADHKLHDTLFCDHAGCPRLMAKMESVDSVLSLEVSIVS